MSEGTGIDFLRRMLSINGAFEFSSVSREDTRGQFARHFSSDMVETEMSFCVAQANVSRTTHKHTFRGMHFQIPPFAESKLVSCLSGEVIDIIVDLRPDSPTYLQSESVILSEERGNSMFVPIGVANGYLTLDRDALVHYYSSAKYSPSHERGFRYDDSLVSIRLPSPPFLVSDKDRSWGDLNENELQIFRRQI